MFNTNENRIGALAGMVALVLVLALTVMAFTALSPEQRDEQARWDVSAPQSRGLIAPGFGS
jgi:hypothetical protein